MLSKVVLALALSSASACDNEPSPLSRGDVRRARSTTPSSRVTASTHEEIAAKLTAAVRAGDAPVKTCEEFAIEELNQLVRDLHCEFHDDLDTALEERDGRKVRFVLGGVVVCSLNDSVC